MNYEEFLQPRNADHLTEANEPVLPAETEETVAPEELDVQKTVVEELAADKAVLNEQVNEKDKLIENLKSQLAEALAECSRLKGEFLGLRDEVAKAKDAIAAEQALTARAKDELAQEKEKQFDQQERNPNALALLDREVELPDRFPGETRDQVLEALKEARDRAEADGRCRRAQILESVLVANEPNGTLAQKREELKKLFVENGNVVNGTVLEELKKLGISHKNGEEYLLVDEIIKRTY